MTDLAGLSATDLLALYATKKASPVEATQAALDRIAKWDRTVNAWILVDGDSALAAARESEARWAKGAPAGPVDGVPTGIKDLVLTKGWPTLRGSLAIDPDQPWEDDAPSVARLRESGAVLLGKTTTPEFGWKGVTDSPLTGITRNPWNTARTPGGSSGGASAACALGMGALQLGSDGGGSIRIPGAFTGVYGIKANFGRVPTWPASPFGTLSHVGPLTRTVSDAALMLTVFARPDARDWYALPWNGEDYTQGLDSGVAGLRIAYSPTLGYADVAPDVAARVEAAVEVYEELGATIERVDHVFDDPHECFTVHWYTGAANVYRTFDAEQVKRLDPGLVEVAETGLSFSLPRYLDAVKERELLGLLVNRIFESYDLLLTPMMPTTAFQAGVEVPDPSMSRWTRWSPFTYPFNLTQHPAATVPCGFGEDGLPVAFQLVGPKYAEARILAASRAYEAVNPFAMPDGPKEG